MKFIVFYSLGGRMRERIFTDLIDAAEFCDSVKGSLCEISSSKKSTK